MKRVALVKWVISASNKGKPTVPALGQGIPVSVVSIHKTTDDTLITIRVHGVHKVNKRRVVEMRKTSDKKESGVETGQMCLFKRGTAKSV